MKLKRSDTEQSSQSVSTKKVIVSIKPLIKLSTSISPSKRISNKHIVPEAVATKIVQNYKQKLDQQMDLYKVRSPSRLASDKKLASNTM